uniref:Uncharacterized protein n=1 Tax=Vitis vinifera TaxID=29760 RepID=F6I3E5_VITVI
MFNAQHQETLMIGESFKEMIMKTSNECLSLLRGETDELFNAIAKTRVNPSPLKSQIEKYMESVDHLDALMIRSFLPPWLVMLSSMSCARVANSSKM